MKLKRIEYKAIEGGTSSAGAWRSADGRWGFLKSVTGKWLITNIPTSDESDHQLLCSLGLDEASFVTRREAIGNLRLALASLPSKNAPLTDHAAGALALLKEVE